MVEPAGNDVEFNDENDIPAHPEGKIKYRASQQWTTTSVKSISITSKKCGGNVLAK